MFLFRLLAFALTVSLVYNACSYLFNKDAWDAMDYFLSFSCLFGIVAMTNRLSEPGKIIQDDVSETPI